MCVRCSSWLFAIALAVLTAGSYAQTYPTKPIRFITSAPGGTSDFTAHIQRDIERWSKVIKEAGIRVM